MTTTPNAVAATDLLDALAVPFRSAYIDHATLTTQLTAWARHFPEVCHLESIGVTPEGRDLWVLTLGPEPRRPRPGVWVDANMHAGEVAGTAVALAIAEDVLRLHLDPDATVHGLPPHVCDVLREVLVVVMPRMAPDGAEGMLTTGRWARSAPRDARPDQAHPRWVYGDVDGDGRALFMRVEDPAGDFAPLPGAPQVLRPRRLEDPGPYYRLYPEGHIAGFDGDTIPDPSSLSDNATDFNRNFPVGWRAEPEQRGAGAFPLSEPETRAVAAYTAARPWLFAWLNLHCFGGVFIRPPGDGPDTTLDPGELALWRQIGAWAEAHAGYPMVSGFEEFTYVPGKPLYGDIVDYAWKLRGTLAWVVELWDIFARLGVPRPGRFVDFYDRLDDADLRRLVAFDAEHNAGRMFPAWRAVDHPQLGPVEVGGFDPRVGLWNPPPEELPAICDGVATVFLKVAAMAPRVRVGVASRPLGDRLHQLTVTLENFGYLPTYGPPSARALPHSEPLHVEVTGLEGDLALVDPALGRADLGHLEGWGRGLHNPSQSMAFPRSLGTRHRLVLRGEGHVVLRVGSCRVGWQTLAFELRDPAMVRREDAIGAAVEAREGGRAGSYQADPS
ncbi:MAG: peptidase M14 [Deltaproteobacteria bacterium]|nr:MAG: peptidase M14 [Deltaproteobacteria bacterium]